MSVYYHPEKWELKVVGEVEDPDASYSFDTLIVWQHTDGRLFWAQDAGCSCPSPFEDYRDLGDLTPIKDERSLDGFIDALFSHCSRSGEHAVAKVDLLREVYAIMRR